MQSTTLIGKAAPLPPAVWTVLLTLTFAAPATIYTLEEISRRKRTAISHGAPAPAFFRPEARVAVANHLRTTWLTMCLN